MRTMRLRTLKSADIKKGTRIILRADFDVALRGNKVLEDFRIKEVIPTIKFILAKGGRLRIISHLGRPGGRRVDALSMCGVALYLKKLLKRKIVFVSDPFKRDLFTKLNSSSDVIFFENLRFFKGEEKNSSDFAKGLACWGDAYVNEAFAVSHRKHASVSALARFLPSFAGLHFEKEIASLNRVLYNPRRPLVAVLGGAKLETKLPLVEKFLEKGGEVLLGGALVNTILSSRGIFMGSSAVDGGPKLKLRKLSSPHLHLPVDFYVASSQMVKERAAGIGDLKIKEINFDIGPETCALFASVVKRARTIVWNGPMGLAENPKFSHGTKSVAGAIKKAKAFRVVGGGDTVAILRKYGLLKGFDHVSTGGGAMLEFLAGKKLPGIEALKTFDQ